MSRTDPQFKLRLPQDLKDFIEKAASTNKRSINAEIVARLEFTKHMDVEEFSTDDRLKEIAEMLSIVLAQQEDLLQNK